MYLLLKAGIHIFLKSTAFFLTSLALSRDMLRFLSKTLIHVEVSTVDLNAYIQDTSFIAFTHLPH